MSTSTLASFLINWFCNPFLSDSLNLLRNIRNFLRKILLVASLILNGPWSPRLLLKFLKFLSLNFNLKQTSSTGVRMTCVILYTISFRWRTSSEKWRLILYRGPRKFTSPILSIWLRSQNKNSRFYSACNALRISCIYSWTFQQVFGRLSCTVTKCDWGEE